VSDRPADPTSVAVKPVTVMVARSVAAGRERDFLAWAEGLNAEAAKYRGSPAPPPRWKTFVMTTSVILVLQAPIALLVSGAVQSWPTVLRAAAIIIPVVALMTWVVMPRLSKLLAGWLFASRS
jgi:antibiotic biosynthesis monooxygenase (ABM) superfamily enzyme